MWDKMIDGFPAQFATQMAAYKNEMELDLFEMFSKAMQEVLVPNNFKRAIRAAVVAGYDAQRMAGTLK